jgi:hypothetical protein
LEPPSMDFSCRSAISIERAMSTSCLSVKSGSDNARRRKRVDVHVWIMQTFQPTRTKMRVIVHGYPPPPSLNFHGYYYPPPTTRRGTFTPTEHPNEYYYCVLPSVHWRKFSKFSTNFCQSGKVLKMRVITIFRGWAGEGPEMRVTPAKCGWVGKSALRLAGFSASPGSRHFIASPCSAGNPTMQHPFTLFFDSVIKTHFTIYV